MSWSQLQAEPAFGFALIGLIIVFGPLVAERLRLPGLLGLLVFGAIVGPNVLDVLPTFNTLRAIGDIGVLYLIFLSGLQLDIDDFRRNWRISAGFGGLTSIFPMVLGTIAASLGGLDFSAALLVGSFWASFTLIAYPIVARYGLTKNRAVSAIVGASSITDTVSLVMLALIVGAETGDVGGVRLVIELAIGFVILAVYCFVIVPRVARWFFAGMGQERTLRFMLVLVALTSSAVVADVVGVEALIGAFFVGVGMNRIVPNASPLMSVTEFFGNAFFIPAFLVSVGLLFDPALMVQPRTLKLAIGFALALVIGKAVAAILTGRIFRLDRAEIGLMFSVSVAQAAATLAATIVGLQAGLYGDDVVNAVMVVVSISLIITSVGSERFAPRVPQPEKTGRPLGEAVLVPIEPDRENLHALLDIADQIASPRGGMLQPIVVATSTDTDELREARSIVAEVDQVLLGLGRDADTRMRVDRSIATGVRRAAIEIDSSLLLLDWPDTGGVRSWLLGGSEREIFEAASVPTAVAALQHEPWARVVFVARRSDLLPGRVPSLLVGSELAAALSDRERPLTVGPLSPEQLATVGVKLPEATAHAGLPAEFGEWLDSVTRPGDLVIVPIDRITSSTFAGLFDSGRSVLAVSHNPATQTRLGGTTLSFPVGGSVAPA